MHQRGPTDRALQRGPTPTDRALRWLGQTLRTARRRRRIRRADRTDYALSFGPTAPDVWEREQPTPWHVPGAIVELPPDITTEQWNRMRAAWRQRDNDPVPDVDTGELRLALRRRIAQVEAGYRTEQAVEAT